MADSKKKKKSKPRNPMRNFTDRLVGKGPNPSNPKRVPKGALRAMNKDGEWGYIDAKTQKFVRTGPKKKKK